MRKLDLENTWSLCLEMWKWIVSQDEPQPVDKLKAIWLDAHGFEEIEGNCFFCEIARQTISAKSYTQAQLCSFCPATKVENTFGCSDPDYHYLKHPELFYEKIVQLDKLRKERKGRSRLRMIWDAICLRGE